MTTGEGQALAWELARKTPIRTGVCSWTDASMLKPGVYYPPEVRTPAQRLSCYSHEFPVVEVDSTYYALPSEANARAWVDRTPDEFIFNIKAFSLHTQHPAPLRGFPKDLREEIAPDGEKRNVYLKNLPEPVVDETWEIFCSTLRPLAAAGKLRAVLFQFPQWFLPGKASRDYIRECAARLSEGLPGARCAVEFRSALWMSDAERQARTLDFLSREGLTYVCVDMPQGFRSSIPPVTAATADLAMIRFHGRRAETWERKNITARERFRYDYDVSELREWVPGVRKLSEEAAEVHVMMNNCYRDYAVRSARTMAQLTLEETPAGAGGR